MAKWPYNTRRWKQLRLAKLAANPACEYCPPGQFRLATQVDHRRAINAGGDPWVWENLASACAGCHSRKTVHVDMRGAARVPVKGCDPATGRPLDPHHWWNRARGGKISRS